MRGIQVGRAFGIPIRLDVTFLLVLPLFAYLIAVQVGRFTEVVNEIFGTAIPADGLTGGFLPFLIGAVAAIGLFGSVLLHEFGHSLTAMRYGYEIESITLWLFGGVARFKEMPEEWKQELVIALAGPVVSVALGVIGFVGFQFVPAFPALQYVVAYLTLMNLVLAGFNMLPGFPMDGGRVLRALLARSQPYAKATQQAAAVGKVFALLLGLFGLLNFDIITMGLAFFIYIAAAGEAQQTVMRAAFEDVTVRDIMTPRTELHTVTPDTSVAELIERMFRERHTGYPVLEGGRLAGMVTLDDAQTVREVEREAFEVREVMATDVISIAPDADAISALETMQEHGVGRLPVLGEDDELVGLVSRSDLMTAFDIIQSSGSSETIRLGREEGAPSLRAE